MKEHSTRRLGVAVMLLAAFAAATPGTVVFAQEQSPPAQSAQTPVQDDNDFPWGLIGLLGLGGLAGLTRRDDRQREQVQHD